MPKERPNIIVHGDHVDYKHVDYQIGDIASGGIGVNILNGKVVDDESKKPKFTDELFHFIHPSIDIMDDKIKIHNEVKNLVKGFSMGEICKYLLQMEKGSKVYVSNANMERLYAELQRMGMPKDDGFSISNFKKYM